MEFRIKTSPLNFPQHVDFSQQNIGELLREYFLKVCHLQMLAEIKYLPKRYSLFLFIIK